MPAAPDLVLVWSRRAVPNAWAARYLALNVLSLGLLLGLPVGLAGSLPRILGGRGPVPWEEVARLGLTSAGVAGAVAVVLAAFVTWRVRREVRRALVRGAVPLDSLVLVAAAYAEVAGRYQRRPAGALVITPAELRFVAAKEEERAAELRLPLAAVDGVERARDRFHSLGVVLDIQGGITVRRGDEARTFSVVGCADFLRDLQGPWAAATAGARAPE